LLSTPRADDFNEKDSADWDNSVDLALLNAPSQNVLNFQRRVAGVLPVSRCTEQRQILSLRAAFGYG